MKKYFERNDIIAYQFKKQGEIWIGEYSGDEVGKGTAKCILTQVSDDIFDSPRRTA